MLPRTAALRSLRRFDPVQRTRWTTRRTVSSSSSTTQPGPIGNFYKTFTRPVAKCFLIAVFTYQLVYWAWVKLETDEIKVEKEAEIANLEAQVRSLQKQSARDAK